MKGNARNTTIDILRFLFAIIIFLNHAGVLGNGYLGVEFFCIVSGYYMAHKVEKLIMSNEGSINAGKETIKVLWAYIRRLFPYIVVAYCFALLIEHIRDRELMKVVSDILNSIGEPFLLLMTGFGERHLTPSWYISALLLSMLIILPIYMKLYEVFPRIYAPLFVLLWLGFSWQYWGYIPGPYVWLGVVYSGVLRVAVGICLGIICFTITKYWNNTYLLTYCGKCILFSTGIICFIFVWILMAVTNTYHIIHCDYIMWGLMFWGCSLVLCDNISSKFNFKKDIFRNFSRILGEISLPFYLSHSCILNYFQNKNGEINLPREFVLAILLATLQLLFVKKFLPILAIGVSKTKVIFIQNSNVEDQC